MTNFWKQLPKPFFALAPMDDVSDTVFREIVASVSAPGKLHLMFTEFMSVEGFLHEIGKERVARRLFHEASSFRDTLMHTNSFQEGMAAVETFENNFILKPIN